MNIVKMIARSCNISEADAQIEYNSEIENLRSLAAQGDLRQDDLEDACYGLGLDLDCIETMLLAIA